MKTLLKQRKERRINLGFKQTDMMLRIGVSRQQYQHLESKGNPRLDTLELIAKGLNSELLLIPKEKLAAVLTLLEEHSHHDKAGDSSRAIDITAEQINYTSALKTHAQKSLSDDPWQDLLGDDS